MSWRTSDRVRLRCAIVLLGAVVAALPKVAGSELYWTTYAATNGGINRADVSSLSVQAVVPSGLVRPYRIAVEPTLGKVYWSSTAGGATGGGIRRCNLDGSGIELIASPSNSSFRLLGLAIDHVHGKIVYSENRSLVVANLDGSNKQTFATVAFAAIQDVAIDSVHQRIYFSDYNGTGVGDGVIRCINFDGTGLEPVGAFVPQGPIGLGVDAVNGKLYWGSLQLGAATGSLFRGNLDGTSAETIVPNADVDSLALDVEGGKVYWTDADDYTAPRHILRANLNGTQVETLPLGTFAPGGITVIPEPASLLAVVCLAGLARVHLRVCRG